MPHRRTENLDTMKEEASAWQHHRNNKKATITNNKAQIK